MKKITIILIFSLLILQGCTSFPTDWPWEDICGDWAPHGTRGHTEKVEEDNK